MDFTVKISAVGDGAGITLPKEVLSALKAGVGDTVTLASTRDGFVVTSLAPAAFQQLELAREIMRLRRDVLGDLAKQ